MYETADDNEQIVICLAEFSRIGLEGFPLICGKLATSFERKEVETWTFIL